MNIAENNKYRIIGVREQRGNAESQVVKVSEVEHIYRYVPTVLIPLTFSRTIRPYRPSHLVKPLDSIQRPHKADECKFLLVIMSMFRNQ